MPLDATVGGRDTLLVELAGEGGPTSARLVGIVRMRAMRSAEIIWGARAERPGRCLTARASRVRWPMMRRSHWAARAITLAKNSPAVCGQVDTEVESDQIPPPGLRPRHERGEVDHERRGRSSLATTMAEAAPDSTAASAAVKPGRSRFLPLRASSWMATRAQPLTCALGLDRGSLSGKPEARTPPARRSTPARSRRRLRYPYRSYGPSHW